MSVLFLAGFVEGCISGDTLGMELFGIQVLRCSSLLFQFFSDPGLRVWEVDRSCKGM